MYHIVPLHEITAAEDPARKEMDKFLGDNKETI